LTLTGAEGGEAVAEVAEVAEVGGLAPSKWPGRFREGDVAWRGAEEASDWSAAWREAASWTEGKWERGPFARRSIFSRRVIGGWWNPTFKQRN
jgi:hypothetical protein